MTRMGVCLSSLFSSLKRGLTVSVPVLPISDAVHCNRSRSALQPSLQCTASFPANVCIRHRKRLHPGLQTLSSVLANVITEKTPSFKNLFPCFSTEPAPSKVCAPEAQRPGEGRTTPYIYILWYREVQQKLPGGPSSKRGIQKAETEISNCSAI